MQVLLIYIFMKSSPIDHLLVRESLRGFVADAGGARLTSASPFGSPTMCLTMSMEFYPHAQVVMN
jgi:hypothetical protein